MTWPSNRFLGFFLFKTDFGHLLTSFRIMPAIILIYGIA
ncbi:hypothetical protein N826_33200 [Skermanella aerolata KACC 11604]|nr:hypothetical protein N826_33200 [Skermanella aerolata KACC 11604]